MSIERSVNPHIGGKRSTRSPDRAIAGLADQQHGIVGRGQLTALGLSRHSIEGRLERGSLYPVHRGVYSVGRRSLSREGRWIAAVLACGPGAVLSHRSAGELLGLLPRSSRRPEVIRAGGWRAPAGVIAHRSPFRADEIEIVDGIPATSVFRTLFDLAAALSKRELERAMNEVEVRRLTGRLSLPHLLDRYPGHRGTKVLRELLAAKTPGGITRNDFEERFLEFLDDSGLPRPRFNATLALRGRFFEVDCLWREQRLVVELDGGAVHRTSRAFESDRQRDRILLAEGWRGTRITWLQLRDEPAAIAADLRQTLRGVGRAPTL